MTVIYRCPLWTSGRYGRFYCISNSIEDIFNSFGDIYNSFEDIYNSAAKVALYIQNVVNNEVFLYTAFD